VSAADEFVTKGHLDALLRELEERIEGRRLAYERRQEERIQKYLDELRDYVKTQVEEIWGHVKRVIEEGVDGRMSLLESNQAMVNEYRRATDRADQLAAAADRHRAATAARLESVDEKMSGIKASIGALTTLVSAHLAADQAPTSRKHEGP
jgi:chromosome segregation ATPase